MRTMAIVLAVLGFLLIVMGAVGVRGDLGHAPPGLLLGLVLFIVGVVIYYFSKKR